MTPGKAFMQGARAALAGALIMFLSDWVFQRGADQQGLTPEQMVGGVVALLVAVLLLLDIDWHFWRRYRDDHDGGT